MNKKITTIFIIFISVFALALTVNAGSLSWVNTNGETVKGIGLAVGEVTTISLRAEVPEDKNLKAYSFKISYGGSIAVEKVVAAPDAAIAPATINQDTPGKINVNGFDLTGVEAGNHAFINITLKGAYAGNGYVVVKTTAFGAESDDQFIPKGYRLGIAVK